MASQHRWAGGTLEDVAHAKASLADRVRTPWWYHPVIGILVAQHVVVQGADGGNATLPSGMLLLGGCALLWLWWRMRLGLTIGAWCGERSLFLLSVRSLLALVCVWAAAWFDAVLVVGVAAIVGLFGTVLLGWSYDAALRQDLADSGE